MKAPKIITTFVNPPIPVRSMDWQAHYEGEEELGNNGYGATEAEAIADLKENYPLEEEPSPANFEQTFGCLGCICRMSSVNSASIDPPEPILDRWCAVHSGRDPDAENDARRDDEMERRS